MRQLERSDRRLLLVIARRAIEEVLCGEPFDFDAATVPASLREPAAAFVTLRERGDLRGCIGTLRFEAPLWRNVREAAVSAALNDPRFPRVRAQELSLIELEVSVLDPPVPLPDPSGFVAGRHGIIVERGWHRGLLLPQVAPEMGWGERQMLDAVCDKAGLRRDAWRDPETRLFVFESMCFSEAAELGSAEPAQPIETTDSTPRR